jgi:phage shock protein C
MGTPYPFNAITPVALQVDNRLCRTVSVSVTIDFTGRTAFECPDESDPLKSNKRLYKSEDPIFAGVCGGIAEYFDFDPTLVRILTVVLVLIGFGLPIIAYIVAMLLMPKKSAGYPDYIEVKPAAAQTNPATAATAATGAGVGYVSGADKDGFVGDTADSPNFTQATAGFATEPEATPRPPQGAAPGSGYTACNPRAYDCGSDQSAAGSHSHHGLHSGVMLGIVLVGIGILALVGTFIDVSLWRFWPLFIIIAGFVTLCTPGRQGWSLERAGNGISTISVGFVLQLWMFEIIEASAFFLTFFNLWPILLVVIGLSIIGSATEQSIFKLLGSLLFSAALVFGVWSFGHIGGPFNIDLPGGRGIEITVPTPDFLPDDASFPPGDER